MQLLHTDKEAMRALRDKIEAYDKECEEANESDTEVLWELLNEASTLIENHLKQEPIFEVLTLAREDIEGQGFDASGLADDEMERFADRLGESLMESGDYWTGVDSLAEVYELKEMANND